jgi:hypothetical protein
MNETGLPALAKVVAHEREGLGSANDETCFEQAMSYGWFHEDSSDWPTLAGLLSRKQAASLYPAICHALIRGGAGFSPLLVECYSLLEQWQNEQLRDNEKLTRSLVAVRKLVFETGLYAKSLWWHELSITMQLIEYAVAIQSGQHPHPIMQAYETFGYDFEEAVKVSPRR